MGEELILKVSWVCARTTFKWSCKAVKYALQPFFSRKRSGEEAEEEEANDVVVIRPEGKGGSRKVAAA